MTVRLRGLSFPTVPKLHRLRIMFPSESKAITLLCGRARASPRAVGVHIPKLTDVRLELPRPVCSQKFDVAPIGVTTNILSVTIDAKIFISSDRFTITPLLSSIRLLALAISPYKPDSRQSSS